MILVTGSILAREDSFAEIRRLCLEHVERSFHPARARKETQRREINDDLVEAVGPGQPPRHHAGVRRQCLRRDDDQFNVRHGPGDPVQQHLGVRVSGAHQNQPIHGCHPAGRCTRSAGSSMSATAGNSAQRKPASRARSRVWSMTRDVLQETPVNRGGSGRDRPTRT